MKTCTKCGETKPENEFYFNKKGNYYGECKKCYIKKTKKYHLKNPQKRWASGTLGKHKKRGFRIQITIEELVSLFEQTTHCIYCDQKMERNKEILSSSSPTLDILDPKNKVVDINNIQIICHSCNSSKRNRTHQELVDWCKIVVQKFDT